MKKYYYCSVLPKGMKNTYYYIADEEVKVNAFVEFPFGYENTLVIGTVMEVGFFDEDNVPFPVERTKHILRTVSQEEFDAYPGFYAAQYDDDDDDIEYELEEAEDYILCEDYDAIFDWAYDHQRQRRANAERSATSATAGITADIRRSIMKEHTAIFILPCCCMTTPTLSTSWVICTVRESLLKRTTFLRSSCISGRSTRS